MDRDTIWRMRRLAEVAVFGKKKTKELENAFE